MMLEVSFLNIGDLGMSIVSVPVTIPYELVSAPVEEVGLYIHEHLWMLGYTEKKAVTIKELEIA